MPSGTPYRWRERSFGRFADAVLEPVRAVRFAHLPVLAIYGAAGALGLISVADSFWVKGTLTLSAAELAAVAVWLQLPWIAKMVVSELVDARLVPHMSHRAYILSGASLVALGLVMLAGAAGGWLAFMAKEHLYVLAQLLIVIGGVVQEVVADALVPGLVTRTLTNGRPRSQASINAELAMIEVLARLAYTVAALICGGLAGRLAAIYAAQDVYMMALVVPLLSIAGALLAPVEDGTSRPIDRRIFATGVVLAASALVLGLGQVPQAQELVFVAALLALAWMLRILMRDLAPHVRRQIVTVAFLAFAFRTMPSVGDGYRWFAIDRLGFDEAFFGTLQMTGTGVGLMLMWLLSRAVSELPVQKIIWLLTAIAVLLLMPMLLLAHGVHHWTAAHIGLGPRSLALIDEAAQSPLALLATVPLLALVAVHAPRDHRATWFAVIASLMSLAIVAGQLLTKYLNMLFPVERGAYEHLPALVTSVVIVSAALPLGALALTRLATAFRAGRARR